MNNPEYLTRRKFISSGAKTFAGIAILNPFVGYANSPLAEKKTDYEKMILQTKPDKVIVTTIDGTHHSFITKAMELGCDVIT